MRPRKQIPLRYAVHFRLDTDELVDVDFDRLNDAAAFARRISEPWDWFEIVDRMTMNVVARSEKVE